MWLTFSLIKRHNITSTRNICHLCFAKEEKKGREIKKKSAILPEQSSGWPQFTITKVGQTISINPLKGSWKPPGPDNPVMSCARIHLSIYCVQSVHPALSYVLMLLFAAFSYLPEYSALTVKKHHLDNRPSSKISAESPLLRV